MLLAVLCADPGSGKYRYSPERLKKAGYCRAEDLSAEGRPGRRTSGELVAAPLLHSKTMFCFMENNTKAKPSLQA